MSYEIKNQVAEHDVTHEAALRQVSDMLSHEIWVAIGARGTDFTHTLKEQVYVEPIKYEGFGYLNGYSDETLLQAVRDSISISREDLHHKSQDIFFKTVLVEGSDRLSQAYELYEEFEANRLGPQNRPSTIIIVPIAIGEELLATVESTLKSLSQQSGIETCEVVLFANYSEEDQGSATHAQATYDSLREHVLDTYPGLHIISALKGYAPQDLERESMVKVRRDYMDAVAVSARDRDLPIDTAVVWLDADTTAMSEDAIASLSSTVKLGKTPFVHANIRYSVDGFRATDKPDHSNPLFVAAMDELARRRLQRLPHDTAYLEECGLTFTLGTYYMLGGLGGSGAVSSGESQSLQDSLKIIDGSPQFDSIGFFGFDKGGKPFSQGGRKSLIKYPKTQLVYGSTGRTQYVPSARVYTSARRIVDNIKKGVNNPRMNYTMGELHRQPYRSETTTSPIPRSVGKGLVDMALAKSRGLSLLPRDEQERIDASVRRRSSVKD